VFHQGNYSIPPNVLSGARSQGEERNATRGSRLSGPSPPHERWALTGPAIVVLLWRRWCCVRAGGPIRGGRAHWRSASACHRSRCVPAPRSSRMAITIRLGNGNESWNPRVKSRTLPRAFARCDSEQSNRRSTNRGRAPFSRGGRRVFYERAATGIFSCREFPKVEGGVCSPPALPPSNPSRYTADDGDAVFPPFFRSFSFEGEKPAVLFVFEGGSRALRSLADPIYKPTRRPARKTRGSHPSFPEIPVGHWGGDKRSSSTPSASTRRQKWPWIQGPAILTYEAAAPHRALRAQQ